MHKKIGILLINLGTPDGPMPSDVRRYLKEFLSDRRVVEIPPILWQPILRGIILTTRPRKSARAYQLIWNRNGSPLAAFTRSQADGLAGVFGDDVIVDYAMRYGKPKLSDRLNMLIAAGCDRILCAPLYPQYCGATTASAHDAIFAALGKMRVQPAIRILPPYYADPVYIEALRQTASETLTGLDFTPDAILTSFHGMPQRTADLGDPYYAQCQETSALLSKAMGQELILSFQSRFGRAKWLEPATDKTLAELPGKGVKKIAILAPGFSADCLETLEELAMQGRETFLQAGGTDFAYIPCLNNSRPGMTMLSALLARELEGWRSHA